MELAAARDAQEAKSILGDGASNLGDDLDGTGEDYGDLYQTVKQAISSLTDFGATANIKFGTP